MGVLIVRRCFTYKYTPVPARRQRKRAIDVILRKRSHKIESRARRQRSPLIVRLGCTTAILVHRNEPTNRTQLHRREAESKNFRNNHETFEIYICCHFVTLLSFFLVFGSILKLTFDALCRKIGLFKSKSFLK